MSERTDSAIILRFVFQAMRNAGLPAEQVLMGARADRALYQKI